MLRLSLQLKKRHRAAFAVVLSCFLLYAAADGICDAFVPEAADGRIFSGLTDCCCDDDGSKYVPVVVWMVAPSEPPPFTGKELVQRADELLRYKKIFAPAPLESRAPPSFS
jgi:hypothetical protein